MEQDKRFSIGEAARVCRVTVKQIRNWEEKKYIPVSKRILCGKRSYRQFSEKDLKIIRAIKRYLDEGYGLPTAARKAAAENIERLGGNENG